MKMKRIKIEWNDFWTFRIALSSGDDDDYPGCSFHLALLKFNLTLKLPQIIKPTTKKVIATTWNEETVKRIGRNWYEEKVEREYSIAWSGDHVSIHYGALTHDSETDKYKGFFIPWIQYRFVRLSYYNSDGKLLFNEPKKHHWGIFFDTLVPKSKFNLIDFDGEEIEATVHTLEREWRKGEGYFKWISLFYKPIIRRCIEINFNKEVGEEKGSWKGGTIGHSIELLKDEMQDGAMKRYCEKHNLKFVNKVEAKKETNNDAAKCSQSIK